MKFRKKPVIVEAEQFFYDQLPIKGVFYPRTTEDGRTYLGDAFVITAHDQRVYLSDGDWILPEPDGEHYYPVKDDIFKATYEYARDLEDGYDPFSNTTKADRAAMPKTGAISHHSHG